MSTGTPTGAAAGFAGYDVAAVGRRISARLLDGMFGLILYGAEIAAALSLRIVLLELVALFALCWLGFVLYCIVGLAATPGQLALGLRQLDADTGAPSGGRAFLKQLVMGVLGTITLGLAPVVAMLFLQGPWKRSWFDRMAGTVVGRRTDVTAYSHAIPAPPAPPVPPPAPVTSPSYEPSGPSGGGPMPDWAVEAPTALGGGTSVIVPAPTLVLDDGSALTLDRPQVLGRDPMAPPSHPDAVAHVVADPQRSLSKTHLLLEADRDGVWCIDLHSTNGVSLTDAAGGTVTVVPGVRTLAPAGGMITYGRRTVRLPR